MIAELQEREKLNGHMKIPSILELIQITINRKQWSSRTPFQKWCYIYGIGKACIKPTGFSVYDNDLSIKFRSYFITLGILGYFLLGLYTVFYYTEKGEFVKCLPSTCLYCIAFSVRSSVSILDKFNEIFYKRQFHFSLCHL